MESQEFFKELDKEPGRYTYKDNPAECRVTVTDKRFDTTFEVGYAAIHANDWHTLHTHFAAGRDVKHITRVTGYYATTESFNKGKLAELHDRHHANIV